MIQITPFTPEHQRAVVDLILDIWENEFNFKGLARPDLDDISGTYQSHPDNNFWVALEDEQLVGTVALQRATPDTAHLKRMVVKKSHRHQGLGERLLQTALDFARQHNYKTILAGTVPENPNAIAFYQGYGFQLTEEAPAGITAMHDSICLKLDLV